VSGLGPIRVLVSGAERASTSACSRAKSKIRLFSSIGSGWTDLGIMTTPIWMSHRRMIWAGVLPYCRGTFPNVKALTAAIMQYLEKHNQNPQVFVWSAPVEQILPKIAKCEEA
jgi:hypothetical protein